MGNLPSLEEVTREINLPGDARTLPEPCPNPGPEEMLIDPTVYVFGMADVAGEIMRFTTSTIGKCTSTTVVYDCLVLDPAVAAKSVNFMRELHNAYVSLQEKGLIYRTKNMNQKESDLTHFQNSLKNDVIIRKR